MTNDQRIAALKPGQSLRLSGDAAHGVIVERSGNGKVLRFVRVVGATSTVFRVTAC